MLRIITTCFLLNKANKANKAKKSKKSKKLKNRMAEEAKTSEEVPVYDSWHPQFKDNFTRVEKGDVIKYLSNGKVYELNWKGEDVWVYAGVRTHEGTMVMDGIMGDNIRVFLGKKCTTECQEKNGECSTDLVFTCVDSNCLEETECVFTVCQFCGCIADDVAECEGPKGGCHKNKDYCQEDRPCLLDGLYPDLLDCGSCPDCYYVLHDLCYYE